MKNCQVTIPAKAAASYGIKIGSQLLSRPAIWLNKNIRAEKIVIITDHHVKKCYGNSLLQLLRKKETEVHLLSFPAGEKSKHSRTKEVIEKQLMRLGCGRNTLILALGGGVVGDMAGFVAATYLRGIPYMQLPTSLLAMIDSSVGGKTGIDTPYGKNLVGAFWQPLAVIADMTCLASLSQKHMINGLIEAIKIFLTHAAGQFYYVRDSLHDLLAKNETALTRVIYHAVKLKADVVSRDEKETNLRMTLNFGHTIGHALERITDYKLLHGFAVGYGILVEAKIAQQAGYLSNQDYSEIQTLLSYLGIKGRFLKKYRPDVIVKATKTDKKMQSGKSYYILLKQIGEVQLQQGRVAQAVSDAEVKKAILTVSNEGE